TKLLTKFFIAFIMLFLKIISISFNLLVNLAILIPPRIVIFYIPIKVFRNVAILLYLTHDNWGKILVMVVCNPSIIQLLILRIVYRPVIIKFLERANRKFPEFSIFSDSRPNRICMTPES